MDATPEDLARTLARLIGAYRFHFTDEKGLQDGIEQILHGAGFEREFPLTDKDRIDFFSPATRVGIEVKVKGSRAPVIAQLLRYAGNEKVAALVLVTSRIKLGALPPTIGGKTIIPVSLWANGL